MREWIGYSDESSEKRLVDENVGLAYRMDHNQMSVHRPWEIIFLVVNYFLLT